MATINLREYLTEIETLLHNDGYERAIALCQHGLRSYPRCVEFYCLLGQACLETERHDDAADMFRRVLGADPESFVAHVGLGVVADGIGAVDEAIWQLQRALEVEPDHVEVRQELQRMLARKDGKPQTGRLKLNRAALGRIYMKGEQYDRAAAEFRAVLNSVSKNGDGKHDRFDLQVALAEALYRGGHQREAAEVCQQLLKILPNVLKANLILGDIYLETGREDDARPLFDRAQALDPENLLAQQLLNQPSPLMLRQITVEMPSGEIVIPSFKPETPAQPSLKEAETALPWLRETATAPTTTEPAEALPEWLQNLRAQTTTESPTIPTTTAEAPSAGVIPDWLTALRDAAPTVTTDTVAAAGAEALERSDEPAWLRELRASAEPEASTAEAVAPEATLEEPATQETAQPTWLDQLQVSTPAEATAAEPTAEQDITEQAELPDWLRALQATPTEAESAPTSVAQTQGEAPSTELPDWLKSLHATDEPGTAATTVESSIETTAPAPPEEGLPAWLMEWQQPEAVTAEAEISEAITTEEEPAAAPTLGETIIAEPPRAPREAIAYFDDSAAPPSVEEQAVPTGEAEYQARLELARTMKDIDVDSALDLYALMADASPALRQQAMDDLTALAATHPRAQSILQEWLGAAPAPITPEVAEPEPAPSLPQWLLDLQRPAPTESAETLAEEAEEQPTPTAPIKTPEAPLVTEESLELAPPVGAPEVEPETPTVPIVDETMATAPERAPREAIAYFDDSAAPPSIEAQAAPTGEAEYQARLELARTMKDIDVDSALDQYMLMIGASDALLQQAIGDVSELTRTHAHNPRTHVVLEQLQNSVDRSPFLAPERAQAVADLQPMAPPSEEIHEPAEPIVAEETMEAAQPLAETPVLPVVDETLAAEPPPAPAPRKATAYLDDAAAPPSVEAQPTPRGTAEFRARLELARALKFMDVDEALDLYAQLGQARADLREQAIRDLEELAKKNPRAQQILDQLRGATIAVSPPTPTAAAPLSEPTPLAQPEVEAPIEAVAPIRADEISAKVTPAPREAIAYFDDSAAPPSIETQRAPTGEAEQLARLELARTLRALDLHESAEQYKALIDANTPLLGQVIDDLRLMAHEHPDERGLRVLLADALTRAGRFQEAVELYRQLV